MTLEEFNELYIGVAMIFNGQAPANATLLTDDEMRNIKGSWHTEYKIRVKWIPGWIQWVKWRVTVSFKIPYIKLNWVSVYRWGPVNIGYFWPQLCWKRITISKVISIPIYHPGHLVFYTERVRAPDPWDLSPKGQRMALEAGFIASGVLETAAGLILTPPSGGTSTALTAWGVTNTIAGVGLFTYDYMSNKEPLFNKDPDPGAKGPVYYYHPLGLII